MTLEKTTKRLTGPGGTGLTVLGKVDSLLEVIGTCRSVSRGLPGDGQTSRLQERVSSYTHWPGITLKRETEPVCLYTTRKVPHPLQQRVKEELERMQRQSVILAVREPTEWILGMVPVLKLNGRVCVCVDGTQLRCGWTGPPDENCRRQPGKTPREYHLLQA